MPEAYQAYENLSKLLNTLGSVEFPLAVRGTLNQLAYESRVRLSTVEMPEPFMLRNDFENKKSLHYERSDNTLQIEDMESSMGQMAVVRFRKGPAPTKDLFEQEFGQALPPRQGRELRRTPTLYARKNSSPQGIVRREFQPSKGLDWLSIEQIERMQSAKKWDTYHEPPEQMRQRRAIAILIRKNYKDPFILKDAEGNPSVYVIRNKKAKKIHTLTAGKKAIQPKKTVEPAAVKTLERTGEFFVEQADRRFKKAADKYLGAWV